MHSCGSVRELIPDFIDMGLDIRNSFQPQDGGITGTIDEAVSEAEKRLEIIAPSNHYIQDVTVESFIKIHEITREYGRYPIYI